MIFKPITIFESSTLYNNSEFFSRPYTYNFIFYFGFIDCAKSIIRTEGIGYKISPPSFERKNQLQNQLLH